jgi:HAD superfamily hydrolase (TIGR02253 family)
MKMIKVLIFDLDNTLIDFMRMKRIAVDEAMDAMIDAGLTAPRKEALEQLYKIYFQEGLEDPEIFQKFLMQINGKVDYKILAYAIVAYRRAREGFLHPYPGVKATLIKIKERGLKLAIVSDAPKLKAWTRLVNMKIDDFFDVVVAFDDTGERKPSALPFNAALKELKIKPEECLMIGDMPQRDMVGAKAVGMKTCFAKYGFEGDAGKVDSDYVIENIADLIKIIDDNK